MRNHRRWFLLSTAAAVTLSLVGLGIYGAMHPLPRPGVTLENFRRLHKYMSRAQIEAILGKGELDGEIVRWKSGNTQVAIAFYDRDEAAVGSFYEGSEDVAHLREDPIGAWEGLRLWVHQQTGW